MIEDNNQKKVLYDKFHNCYEYSNGILNINCIKRAMALELFDMLYKKNDIKEINIKIEDSNLLDNISKILKKYKTKKINININQNDKINTNLIDNIKSLNDNIKIKYKKIINYSKERRLINVDNINVYDMDTTLLYLSNSELEKVISKFDEESKRYVLLEKEIVKKVYTLSKRKYPNIDELDDNIKRNIVYNYIKNNEISNIDDISNDPLVTFIKKSGSIIGQSKLFNILLNNKYFNVKENDYFSYMEKEKSNTLKNVSVFTA